MVMDHLRLGKTGRRSGFYTTDMRLSVDPELIVTVRWYEAPPGAKILPADHAFMSNVWETNARDYPSEDLGEVSLEREFDRGVPPVGVTGQSTPTPLSWFRTGVPAEFHDAGPYPFGRCPLPPPAPLVAPFIWIRREEIAALADNDPIDPWPAAVFPGVGMVGVAGTTPPTKQTDPATGQACALFQRGTTHGSVDLLNPEAPSESRPFDFTVYLVGRGDTALTATGPQLGILTQSITKGWPRVTDTQVRVDSVPLSLVWANPIGGDWTLWSVRLRYPRMELHWNGIEVAATNEWPVSSMPAWALFCQASSATANRSCVVGELLVLPYATEANEHLAWKSYLARSWGLSVLLP